MLRPSPDVQQIYTVSSLTILTCMVIRDPEADGLGQSLVQPGRAPPQLLHDLLESAPVQLGLDLGSHRGAGGAGGLGHTKGGGLGLGPDNEKHGNDTIVGLYSSVSKLD